LSELDEVTQVTLPIKFADVIEVIGRSALPHAHAAAGSFRPSTKFGDSSSRGGRSLSPQARQTYAPVRLPLKVSSDAGSGLNIALFPSAPFH
jgi:hypothetical protein